MQKKNKKLSLTETIQGMGAKGVIDQTGKSDMDMSGIGSMIPAPVNTSNYPVTVASTMQGNLPVVARTAPGTHATDQFNDVTNPEGENIADESEVEEGSKKKAKTTEVEENFIAALGELLGENLDASLLGKLEAIFEAAVTDRVESKLAEILVELDEDVKTHLNTVTESLVEKVDDYLDYVVEEWMTENAIAVEQGIKTQIAENFITGMKNLFENHYIDVPAEKYNVLDDLYAQNRGLNEQLNGTINENINLKKQIALTECAGIFVAETRDLVDTQVVKLQNLMENVSFTTPEEYREKLVAIKENYLARPKAPARIVEEVETFSKVQTAPTTLVEGYVSALGRMNRKA
jgi:hypothetical protein